MATVEDLNAHIDALIAAIDADDLKAAKRASAKAKATLAGIPDAEADGTSVSYRNKIAALDASIKELEQLNVGENGGLGVGIEFR